MRAIFRNLESPGHELRFNKQGVDYHFESDKEYEITEEIFNHINKLGTPRYEFRATETGGVESKHIGWIPRFSFTEVRGSKRIVSVRELEKTEELKKSVGRPRKEAVLA